jgi:acyl-CoA thioester hydrolase
VTQFEDSVLPLTVRPADLDRLGHVNNAVALEYCEAGRWDWLERNGLDGGGEVAAVVARAEVDYLAEIRTGPVQVRTVLVSPSGADLGELTYQARFQQEVRSPGTSRPAVQAVVTVAFISEQTRGLVSLQDFLDDRTHPTRSPTESLT